MKNFSLGFVLGAILFGGSVYGFYAYRDWYNTVNAKPLAHKFMMEMADRMDKVCPGSGKSFRDHIF